MAVYILESAKLEMFGRSWHCGEKRITNLEQFPTCVQFLPFFLIIGCAVFQTASQSTEAVAATQTQLQYLL